MKFFKTVGDDEKLPFIEHLEELRWRLIIVIINLFLFFLVSFYFSDGIIAKLQEGLDRPLVFIAPTEAFFAGLKVAFLSALAFCVPTILYQGWCFISPGLRENEKKLGFPVVIGGTVCFFGGASFAYFGVLPIALKFLLNYSAADLIPMISVSSYISFTLKLMIAFGIVFEYPLLIIILSRLGLVTPEFLSEKRKYAILIIAIVSAILTPPDVFSQILMIIPLVVLYEISIVLAKVFGKKKITNHEGGGGGQPSRSIR